MILKNLRQTLIFSIYRKMISPKGNGTRFRNELICFAKVVESCSVRGYIDKFYGKMNIVSSEENAKNLARALHEFTS